MLAVWSSASGCRSDETSGSTNNGDGGSGGSGGSSPASTGASAPGVTVSSAASSGSGGAAGPKLVTVKDITTGVVGPKVSVQVKGVVAMSRKFFVSKGSASGSCLWGVFVSDPGLTETAPNTGTLVLSYGSNAMTPPDGGAAACPKLGLDTTGDKIPDDVRPGDVLDVVGLSDSFVLTQCGMKPGETKVPEYQISQAASVTKAGKATPPTPHVLTAEETTKLASQTDTAFYNQWGGVKVRIKDVTSVPQTDGAGMPNVVDKFGKMVLTGGSLMAANLAVPDKLYFNNGLKDTSFCYRAPVYPPTTTFTSVDGIIYLDFCTWSLEPTDKCADLAPPSADAMDCNGSTTACAEK